MILEAANGFDTSEISRLVECISEVDGVACAVASTSDGLVVDGRGEGSTREPLAAIGTQLLLSAAKTEGVDGVEPARSITASWDDGSLLAYRLSPEVNLVVLLARPSNAAYIAYLLNQAADR